MTTTDIHIADEYTLRQTEDRFWRDLTDDIKRRGAEILRREIPDVLTFVERCHAHGIDWEEQLSPPITLPTPGGLVETSYPFHMSGGMEVRNTLRRGGIRDRELPDGRWYYGEPAPNWDDYYHHMIEHAAGIRE